MTTNNRSSQSRSPRRSSQSRSPRRSSSRSPRRSSPRSPRRSPPRSPRRSPPRSSRIISDRDMSGMRSPIRRPSTMTIGAPVYVSPPESPVMTTEHPDYVSPPGSPVVLQEVVVPSRRRMVLERLPSPGGTTMITRPRYVGGSRKKRKSKKRGKRGKGGKTRGKKN